MDAAQGLALTLACQWVTRSKAERREKLAVRCKDLSVLVQHHQKATHGFEHRLDYRIGDGQRC
jgi:peptidyl-tRNA hydrolase